MMARRGRNRRRGSSEGSWLPVIVFGLVLVGLIVGIGYLYLEATSRHVELDEATLCPLTGPTGQTLVLVDTTDAIAPITQTQLTAMLKDAAFGTAKGTLFEIRVLKTASPFTETLFSLCNPGDGRELGEIIANPDLALRKWKEGFEQPLLDAMVKSLTAGAGETSPIMAGIQAVAVAHLTADADRKQPASLVVISDMLENTERFSHYREGTDFAVFEASPAARHFATDLAGKDVSLWVIRRDSRVDSVALVEFWRRWVDYNHGAFASAKALQGIE